MRQHLLVTGSKRSGKSTLIQSLIDGRFVGVRSYAHFAGEGRPQFVYMENGQTGERHIIADRATGKMKPYVDVIDTFGVQCLDQILQSENELVFIDEIGFLELSSPLYCQKLREIFEKKRVIAGLRKDKNPLLDEIFSMKQALLIDMDCRPRVGCVVLAAGQGSRFGSNKLLTTVEGKTLVHHTLGSLPLSMLERVVVVTAYDEVEQIASEYPVTVIRVPSISKSYSIQAGLAELADVDGCLFRVCDQPYLKQTSLQTLIGVFKTSPDAICQMSWQGRNGNPKVIPKSLFPALMEGSGDCGGQSLLHSGAHVINVECRGEDELMDIDTPEDLK